MSRALRALAVAGWVAVCAGGLALLTAAAGSPGEPAARAPRRWPTESRIARSGDHPTLLMFAHTKCACTRASLRELERILARSGPRLDAYVVFSGPRDNDDGFLSIRALARAIAGAKIVDDEAETQRFGALTSGQVVVYDASGDLIFRGGITPSRGHEGESTGNQAVLSIALATGSQQSPARSSDVFGCALSTDRGN